MISNKVRKAMAALEVFGERQDALQWTQNESCLVLQGKL
jgi:hypothetical protein